MIKVVRILQLPVVVGAGRRFFPLAPESRTVHPNIKNLAPHDLRRTCARFHLAGGELEQIQLLLGHASVQTTERYLVCKQRLSQAVNDKLGLEGT